MRRIMRGEKPPAAGKPIGCSVCGLLNINAHDGESFCQRCGAQLRARKPHSLLRAWAYLTAAMILYVPANVYPVLESRTPTESGSHTIIDGILELWAGGSWMLGLLVFFASIVVPILKMLAMVLLLFSIRRRSGGARRAHSSGPGRSAIAWNARCPARSGSSTICPTS